jgi:predicted unusual protein kinase regulating ubiquinone biosynthesis (AarF/ABC1/UbiB family)
MSTEASELMRAYLDQVFVHGLVHADPHPGNVLLMDDQRLALFDLGMVARLSPHTRRHLLKLLLGAIGGNADQVGEISEAISTPLEDFQHGAYRRQIDQLVSGYVGMQDAKRGFSEGRLVLELARTGAICGLRPPPEMGILGKTLLNLEAVTGALDPDLDVRALVQDHLQRVMRQQALNSMSPANLASQWLDMQELARHTPEHMAAILRTLAENRLRVRIDGLEESRMMESMQKIANRVATGIIIAALVVGAALTARIETGSPLLGLPYLSVIFLAVAALLGATLQFSALRRDRAVERAADRESD